MPMSNCGHISPTNYVNRNTLHKYSRYFRQNVTLFATFEVRHFQVLKILRP